MAQVPQNYANHAKFPTSLVVYCALHIVAVLLAATGLVLAMRGADAGLLVLAAGVILQGLTGIGGLTMARFYSLTLQDRIIRLETLLRLQRVLPEDLQASIPELKLSQLIALRFAADDELPQLVRQVLAEKPDKAAWIKQQIKNWQADYLRV